MGSPGPPKSEGSQPVIKNEDGVLLTNFPNTRRYNGNQPMDGFYKRIEYVGAKPRWTIRNPDAKHYYQLNENRKLIDMSGTEVSGEVRPHGTWMLSYDDFDGWDENHFFKSGLLGDHPRGTTITLDYKGKDHLYSWCYVSEQLNGSA